ncbi:RNA polymerase sigma factor [Opitutales bacterium ASA1]|uniref:RNA polymerase sigma factor n=1 Tax=Congregicoccus parvus TaxID=3081749 RepID=UPI002B2AA583|nr:RNA polymerase sigma factor [Opitutales bacterium ASA1]
MEIEVPSPSQEFDALVDQHYRALFSFGHSLTGNEHTAADLVQQTFFRWAEKGSQLRDRTKAKTWLFTTLHREFLQGLRREQRLVEFDNQEELPDERRAAAIEAVEALDAEAVTSALAEIEEVFRVPLGLFYLQEFAYAEIAELLDIPVGTVMSRLSRGKDRLRQRLLARRSSVAATPLPPRKEARRG